MTKNTYIKNGFVSENIFRTAKDTPVSIPSLINFKEALPRPVWKGHEKEIEMYWKAWETGFSHLKQPSIENGFLRSYLDTAYNSNIFMWDSVFISHFSRYGQHAFPFQQTLDNFYCKQHLDGFICREIYGNSGKDAFQRHDPTSTGPNLFAWSEMEYYKAFGSRQRLDDVFPVLCGYHQWLNENRTWKDGSYWTSGWGSGMDNIPRINGSRHPNFSHAHMSWIDANLQQYFNAKLLLDMGFELERWQEIEAVESEAGELKKFINQNMWDKERGFLFDLYSDGSLGTCRHIGAFWALHTDILNREQIKTMAAQLQKGGAFENTYPIPSIEPEHPRFRANGRYWQGGIWAPANYMVLSGLQKQGYFKLAHELGKSHLNHILKTFEKTETFWEYYSPSESEPGFMARDEFIGWTGLVPVSVLFEQVMGIRPFFNKKEIHWNLYLKEEHGIENYPFGPEETVSLRVNDRTKTAAPVVINTESASEFTLVTHWNEKEERHSIKKGKNSITLKSTPK